MSNTSIGENIKELRKKAGLTQRELAQLIGKSFSSVQKYEMDIAEPPLSVINEIARALNVDKYEIIGWNSVELNCVSNTCNLNAIGSTCNEELLEFAAKAAEAGPGDIRAQLLTVMARLNDDQWQVLSDVARQLVSEMDQNKKDAGPD